jgi:hypothetical protein
VAKRLKQASNEVLEIYKGNENEKQLFVAFLLSLFQRLFLHRSMFKVTLGLMERMCSPITEAHPTVLSSTITVPKVT